MTLFAHRCHYCGHKHHFVDFAVTDANYQCIHELRAECDARRKAKGFTSLSRFDSRTAQRLGLWTNWDDPPTGTP